MVLRFSLLVLCALSLGALAEAGLAQPLPAPALRKSAPQAPTSAPALPPHAARLVDEVEPNNAPEEAQVLEGPLPLSVEGNAEVADVGRRGLDIDGDQTIDEDFEDFYLFTTTAPGLRLRLDALTADCDLYLIDEAATRVLDGSARAGTQAEEVDLPTLPAGTYLIAVSIYDPAPGDSATAYVLTLEASTAEVLAEVEPNNTLETAQPLDVGLKTFLGGTVTVEDEGALTITSGNIVDDLEDLFLVTLAEPGFRLTLRLLAADCDVFLADPNTGVVLGESLAPGTNPEFIDLPDLEAGTYLLAVSIYDPNPGADSTFYQLTLENTISTAAEEAAEVPDRLRLDQNYPNPFNPATQIGYALPAAAEVRLEVFDVRGRRVRTLAEGRRPAGPHTAIWDGRDAAGQPLASGIYFYRLTAGPLVQTRTMVLLR